VFFLIIQQRYGITIDNTKYLLNSFIVFIYVPLKKNIIMPKIPYSIKIDQSILDDLKEVASKENRSVNNAIETSLIEYINARKDI